MEEIPIIKIIIPDGPAKKIPIINHGPSRIIQKSERKVQMRYKM